MTEDLWGSVDELYEKPIEENRALDILREQAKLISSKTYGAVKGSFSKVEYTRLNNGLTTAATILGNASKMVAGERIEVESLPELKDFNTKYEKNDYRFEIYNEEYKFRLFLLSYSEEFPIYILADEGIRDEINLPKIKKIEKNDELEFVISDIFASNKVRTVISRMINNTELKNSNAVIQLLSQNDELSDKEISKELNWNIAHTRRVLANLSNKGTIKNPNNKNKTKWILTV